MSVVAKRLDGLRYGCRPWPGDFVLDNDPAPSPKEKVHSPQFSAHIYYGQTDGSIKMPHDTEVGLGPGDIVLDGDSAPPHKG